MTDLDDELRYHLDRRIAQFMAAGSTREEAEQLARERLGDITDLTQYCAALDRRPPLTTRVRRALSDVRQDLHQSLRQVRRQPALAAAVIVTLGLGLGSTTATYAVVHHLLVSPLPVANPDRIVRLARTNKERTLNVTVPRSLREVWRSSAPGLEEIATYTSKRSAVDFGDGVTNQDVGLMSPNFPGLLGFVPAAGRFPAPEEAGVAVVTHATWRSRFGGTRDVVGRSIVIDEVARRIVGVLPADFVVPFVSNPQVDVWMSFADARSEGFPTTIGRMRAGVSSDTLEQQLNALMTAGATDLPGPAWFSTVVRSQDDVGRATADSVLVLFGAVGLVLLAGCANVGNLLLARIQSRHHEFLVRQSLGAGRWRLIRHVLIECSVLALCGWGLSLVVASWCLALARGLRPDALARLDALSIQPWLMAASLALTAVTTLLFGLGPALLASGRVHAGQLRHTGRAIIGDRRAGRWRSALVVVEVSLALVLVTGGGMLVQTLIRMQSASVGFDPSHLVSVEMSRPEGDANQAAAGRDVSLARVLEAVKALPAVAEATWALGAPPDFGVSIGTLEFEGQPKDTGRQFYGINLVTPEYFQVTRTRLTAGRLLDGTPQDAQSVVVSASMARRRWPGRSALGRRLRQGEDAWLTVVGVVDDISIPLPGGGARPSEQMLYTPFQAHAYMTLILRTRPDATGLYPALVSTVRSVDGSLKLGDLASASDAVAAGRALPRFVTGVLIAFSAVALVMVAVGVYGVIAHAVTRRWREMGLRRALGARDVQMLTPVLGESVLILTAGLVVGLSASALAGRALRGLLYQIGMVDMVALTVAAITMVVVSAAAVYVPARRAMHVDPAVVLREEG